MQEKNNATPPCEARRRFLKTSAALAATTALLGPAIVPPSVFAPHAPSERITMAMIGVGRQAYYSNLKTFLGFPDAERFTNDASANRLLHRPLRSPWRL